MKSDPRDSTFERFVKLLSSLTQLVAGGQRCLNIVCTQLQTIVFEETGNIPAYKNWGQICELGQFNWFAMMGIAMLDRTTDGKVDVNNWRIQQIISAYPECFSYEPLAEGPVPLSVIRQRGFTLGQAQGSDEGYDFPVSFDAVPWGIPVKTFDIYGNSVVSRANGPDLLPDGIDPKSSQGSIVVWRGKNFVVLENNESCEEMSIAPAELIDVTV